MAKPAEKLAQSLKVLNDLQTQGKMILRTSDLSRVHRERLVRHGFLKEVLKGWYIPSRPDEMDGESTSWYSSFWQFFSRYLTERFGTKWCLSPEQSVSFLTGNHTVPRQLLVRAPDASNKVTHFPFETSLLDIRSSIPEHPHIIDHEGMRVFPLPLGLVLSSTGFFQNNPTDARTALAMISDPSEVLSYLLEGGHSVIAGRLAGAFRNIGRDKIAEAILETMKSVGYDVREVDPFLKPPTILQETSPYKNRILVLWQDMRDIILEHFTGPEPGRMIINEQKLEEMYVTDAYHSLSIEGYRVSPGLIQRVQSGNWNPDYDEQDRQHRNALAARGYWQAYQAVKASIQKVLQGENPGQVAEDDHGKWYRELFAPSVMVGILQPQDLAGYRRDQVFIRGSMHVPLNRQAVLDAMPMFFHLLKTEPHPVVRFILGHFFFVYIHPYMDGNGRMGRFLMNLMLVAGGYPWVVIPVDDRTIYMAALEEASVRNNIQPFTHYLTTLVQKSMDGHAVATLPNMD